MCELEVRSMNTLDEFKEWLTQNYINNSHLLRAFAVTKLRSNSRVTVLESIDLISQYIFETYKNLPVETAPVEEGVLPDNIEEDLRCIDVCQQNIAFAGSLGICYIYDLSRDII